MSWDRERALDECAADLDVGAYDARCEGCGALFDSQPASCPLCGCESFAPVEDLAF